MYGIVIIAILIWIVAPFVELGIIVALTRAKVENEKKIAELRQALAEQMSARMGPPPMQEMPSVPGQPVQGSQTQVVTGQPMAGLQAQPVPGQSMQEMQAVTGQPGLGLQTPLMTAGEGYEPQGVAGPIVVTAAGGSMPSRMGAEGQINGAGLAALIIGIVFIVLAGLIFATTTWNVLPDICKVTLVLLLTFVFFGASHLAEKKLHIHKTGNGFYILGSIFSFFTVLTAGYYRFLGPAFILEGVNRYRVLWIGSLVTVGIWFLGLKRFRDRLFTQACLWGLTVSMMFLTASFSLGYRGFTGTMVLYAFCLLALEEVLRYQKVWGPEAGDAAQMQDKGCIRMLAEEMKYFVPVHFWLLAAASAVCGLLENFYIAERGGFTLLSLTAALAGIAVFCYRERTLSYQSLFFLVLIDYLYYVVLLWLFPGREIYGCLMIEGVCVLLFFVCGKVQDKIQKIGFLCNEAAGKIICTAFVCVNTLGILLLSSAGEVIAGEELAASGAVVLCALILYWWSKTYGLVKHLVLLTVGYLTVTVYRLLQLQSADCPEHSVFAALYLCGILVWSFIKRQDCWIPVLVVGLLSRAGLFPGAGLIALWGLSGAADRKRERRIPGLDLTGLSLFFVAAVAYYRDPALDMGAFWLYFLLSVFFYLFFYRGRRSWLSVFPALGMLAAPVVYYYRYKMTGGWLCGIVAAALPVTGILARLFVPIVKKDERVEGGWRIDFYHGLSILLILYLMLTVTVSIEGDWMFVYMLLLGGYCFQYATVKDFRGWELCRKVSLTVGAFHLLWAFWIQPFIDFPVSWQWKVGLAGTAVFIWGQRLIWKGSEALWDIQTAGYGLCLLGLALEGLLTGKVMDALLLEGICLLIFVWSFLKNCVRWRRISGILIVAVALYMTKDFWFSISWWVYLLVAGVGLLLFAAFHEKKKK